MRAFTKFVVTLLSAGLLAAAGTALACNTGCAPPAPPTPPHNPQPPHIPCNCGGDHGGGGHGGHNGGSTNVNVDVNVKAGASASGSVFGSGAANYYGGGYGNWSQAQGIPQEAGALNVVGGMAGGGLETYEEEQRMTSMMILQASCIDDTGVPHPASQLDGDRDVNNGYVGEIYRCIAGTHMQVIMVACGGPLDAGYHGGGGYESSMSESSTYSQSESSDSYSQGMGNDGYSHSEHSNSGGYNAGGSSQGGFGQGGGSATCAGMDFNHIDFGNGRTMSCQKGEALWFEQGNLTCRVQIPQRQCNERSLLRRFGAGIKVLTVTRVEKITRQRQVAQSSQASWGTAVMTFDGGVGGFVQ